MLNWVSRFNIFCLLDNHQYNIPPTEYEYLLAVNSNDHIHSISSKDIPGLLKDRRWAFGHISFEFESSHISQTNHYDNVGFPEYFFFYPEILLLIRNEELVIYASHPDQVYNEIIQSAILQDEEISVDIRQSISRETYLDKVKKLIDHIRRGDCYEINFCMEFYAENALLKPQDVYLRLMDVSPNPFAAFYRLKDKYLICASPERYLAKKGDLICSQPIKGTMARVPDDKVQDEQLKNDLQKSRKDQAENVMVVDLVRNDLSRICKPGSVRVDELFGIYSFPQVHQMISTIIGELKKEVSFTDIIDATFPMGSMTGAPKHRVMELISQYERTPRGIFSGTVGYIDPVGNFDFNVVIRSIMYNETKRFLSYKVGSGITFYSDPEKEWEECLLKASAIKKVLAGNQHSKNL